jgi:hypothetical protein
MGLHQIHPVADLISPEEMIGSGDDGEKFSLPLFAAI